MSTESIGKKENSSFQVMTEYGIPLLSSTLSGGMIFGMLLKKSAKQLETPVPSLFAKHTFVGSTKAAPVIGFCIAIQLLMEKKSRTHLIEAHPERKNTQWEIIPSMCSGFFSIPLLIIINGLSIPQSPLKSLRKMNISQVFLMGIREWAFIASQTEIKDPINNFSKETFGENPLIEILTLFSLGATASAIGHSPDTLLTRNQNGIFKTTLRQIPYGIFWRAMALGSFSVLFSLYNRTFTHLLSESENFNSKSSR